MQPYFSWLTRRQLEILMIYLLLPNSLFWRIETVTTSSGLQWSNFTWLSGLEVDLVCVVGIVLLSSSAIVVFFKAASSIYVIDVFRELHACICSGKAQEEEVRVMIAYIISTTWNTGWARLHLSLPLKTMNFCQKKGEPHKYRKNNWIMEKQCWRMR